MEKPYRKAPFTLLMGDIWDKVAERFPQPRLIERCLILLLIDWTCPRGKAARVEPILRISPWANYRTRTSPCDTQVSRLPMPNEAFLIMQPARVSVTTYHPGVDEWS